ncbi:MAG: enolase C-terminal domain-like protein, partial [Thermoanaerobaculia bacterium]
SYTDRSAAVLIAEKLAPVVAGRDPLDVGGAAVGMAQAVRNIGRPGVASTAISAVDIALWDLKAKLLRLPLVKLLGAVRDRVDVYGSGGFTSYDDGRLRDQFRQWASEGVRMMKMKVGREVGRDVRRAEVARRAIGDGVELFVDANGAYSRKQALALAEQFAKLGVTWFEEPVSSNDLDGLRLLRDRAPAGMDIAAGEYAWDLASFRTLLLAGAVDVMQPDATRCGGVTGFLEAAALCHAFEIPLSAHTAPAIHAHLGCADAGVRHIEYFHDHARIEAMLFDGTARPVDGALVPDLGRPGLGIELRRREVERYRVGEEARVG